MEFSPCHLVSVSPCLNSPTDEAQTQDAPRGGRDADTLVNSQAARPQDARIVANEERHPVTGGAWDFGVDHDLVQLLGLSAHPLWRNAVAGQSRAKRERAGECIGIEVGCPRIRIRSDD